MGERWTRRRRQGDQLFNADILRTSTQGQGGPGAERQACVRVKFEIREQRGLRHGVGVV